eukprot:TRINITY_DN13940_c0_g1_i1.p1 TRINITY_DN13940_c0_g1~~TRINITY_DN13940_c0_g1_i1.p1  ORF type:complete len:374 (+),score=140.89 TRINITY_DN13940_c0_g1_i1:63-1184(+)
MSEDAAPVMLTEESPRTAYRRRKGERKTTLHWGQRKLLISEIDFLTRYGTAAGKCVVVYAGAAPATHMGYLSELFPDVEFVLVDPNPFDIAQSPRITILNEYFSTSLAHKLREQYSGYRVLFISDIRTADWKEQSAEDYLKYLNADNAAQAEWSQAVGAAKSMLKFSLPYGEGSTTYLKGDVFLPVWGPQTTTECRLVPSEGEATYGHQAHEERMFHFNTVTRVQVYEKYRHIKGEGYDHRYDCTREIDVLLAYVKAFALDASGDSAEDLVVDMSAAISKRCSRKGHSLATHPLNPFCEPRTAGNTDGQKRRRVDVVATRRVPHPCSESLTEKAGGTMTEDHVVLQSGSAVVMKDSSKVGSAEGTRDVARDGA